MISSANGKHASLVHLLETFQAALYIRHLSCVDNRFEANAFAPFWMMASDQLNGSHDFSSVKSNLSERHL